jgi:hypothetical protein
VGKYLFKKEHSVLLQKGVQLVCYEKVSDSSHARFLLRMGFILSDDGRNYIKKLS